MKDSINKVLNKRKPFSSKAQNPFGWYDQDILYLLVVYSLFIAIMTMSRVTTGSQYNPIIILSVVHIVEVTILPSVALLISSYNIDKKSSGLFLLEILLLGISFYTNYICVGKFESILYIIYVLAAIFAIILGLLTKK